MGDFSKAETYAKEGLEIMDRLNYARGQIECLTVIVKTSDQLEKQNKDYRLKLDELVTRKYSLDEINEAIEDVKSGKSRRNVIVFD